MKFSDAFEDFLRREVNLDQTRIDRAQQSLQAIETYLSRPGSIGDRFVDMIPAGSLAHRSVIRPADASHGFDADVLLELEENSDWLAKDYIEAVYSTFRGSPVYAAKVSRKKRCVRVTYAGDFHVDVVPYIGRNA